MFNFKVEIMYDLSMDVLKYTQTNTWRALKYN